MPLQPTSAAYLAVAGATVLANAGVAVADLARARWVLANSAAVGVPASWVPWLGALKAAGAAGVLLGLLGVPYLGAAAATGLLLFFVGAVVTHVRAGAYATLGYPAAFLALAAACLALAT